MSWIHSWRKSKKRYTWKFIHNACDEIAEEFFEDSIDCIVGLSRGGLIPAVILANTLGIREVFSLGVASYDETTAGDINVYQNLPINNDHLLGCKKILVVDDISDKGSTFKYVTNHLIQQFDADIITTSIFIKPSTSFLPDVYFDKVPDERWVVFPWEL